MRFLYQIYRKTRIFWRYRYQSNNYQTVKYWFLLIVINIALVFLYYNYGLVLIENGLGIWLIVLGGSHLFTIVTMVMTHSIDPGRLPVITKESDNVSEVEEQIPPFNGRIYFGQTYHYQIACKDSLHQIKFCNTCNIFRPKLTSHCSQCKRCIYEMDHHCPWLANCIGKRNYRIFYFHLFCSVIFSACVIALCIYTLIPYYNLTILQIVITTIITIFSILTGFPLAFLWIIHTYFAFQGITTKSFLRNRRNKNPKIHKQKTPFVTVIQKISNTSKPSLNPKNQSQVNIQDSSILTGSCQQFNFKDQLRDNFTNQQNQIVISKIHLVQK